MTFNQTNNNGGEVHNVGVGFIPFAVLWPIVRLVAVPLLRALLPWILEQIAESIRTGQPVSFTDSDLTAAVDQQQHAMQAVYRGQ